ncbi:DNA ligase 4 [Scedosporium apiospermum]|uniref:DNA ligase n=1 Tax=Pseudallescheria apiosperma TaxID=563466 RepID=A0A084GDC4_PSEDA|nr:DNA ligase 4 [Scedosporium apiospermum]KEZ45336.1 DNA ligase 4 [Scedosporium apiospermum]
MSQRIKRPSSPDPEAKDEDERMYGEESSAGDVDAAFPDRPHNVHKTLLFSELFKTLFNPLLELRKNATGPVPGRPKTRSGGHLSVQEQRRHIIERFITRWRNEVGDDFYPAMRLILPDKDRDRTVYGLKESNIGKLLVKLLKIDRNSEDGYNLLHWKLPGQTMAARMAGDFPGRCYDVISKRPMRTEVGDLTIADVNELLDKLAASSSETENLAVFQIFYLRMNPEEMLWLIRIILKQMKIGASENTIFHNWHPDAEALFSVSSSLRQVCWQLRDPNIRLHKEETGLKLGQPFQPQLAQFQMSTTFSKMVSHLGVTEDDPEYWIEVKLDGERMQLHMMDDPDKPGGKSFFFCSRKAKGYTDLYGSGYDEPSALTRFLKGAFSPKVRNLILDGEMVAWNMKEDKPDAFGSLKTAANKEKNGNVEDDAKKDLRPVFFVFDILYLNDTQLGQYTLRDRFRALQSAVLGMTRRLEIHPHVVATSPDTIETELRNVIAEGGEGLVLKNPRSMYRLNSRNDDWQKVKPDYMDEFGESLDCVIIGGYYGSGSRGGGLSSFLCGLRVGENEIATGANPEKCKSFFKVGGGFKVEDYAEIRHHTEGKWTKWDANKPPIEYITLAGGEKVEKPDVWIRPKDSIVISVKGASVTESKSFAVGQTLRFPRFRRLRLDRTWDSALNEDEFQVLRERVKAEQESKDMKVESRKRRPTKRAKRELVIAGTDSAPVRFSGPRTKVFEGLEFCVLSDAVKPTKKTKAQLEAIIKENGGTIMQRPTPETGMIIVADKKLVGVASLMKKGSVNIIRPKWVLDCVAQPNGGYLLPYETHGHLFHATDELKHASDRNTDQFGDSYARDVNVDELAEILKDMPKLEGLHNPFDKDLFLRQLEEHGHGLEELRGQMFGRCVVYFHDPDAAEGKSTLASFRLGNYVRFGGGKIVGYLGDPELTHIVTVGRGEKEGVGDVRKEIASRSKIPRIVTSKWVEESWKEGTLLDEEEYPVV